MKNKDKLILRVIGYYIKLNTILIVKIIILTLNISKNVNIKIDIRYYNIINGHMIYVKHKVLGSYYGE